MYRILREGAQGGIVADWQCWVGSGGWVVVVVSVDRGRGMGVRYVCVCVCVCVCV